MLAFAICADAYACNIINMIFDNNNETYQLTQEVIYMM
jgi:hypothetical protein